MKLLIKATYLFLLGVYAETYKRSFDAAMDRCIKKGGDMSSSYLTAKSNRSYALYVKFREYEKTLRREIHIKKLCSETK